MRLINFFRRPSTAPSTAPVARERLQILLAHERAVAGKSDLIAILQEEIMAVIAKHFPVEQEAIKVNMERGEVVSTLEVEVDIPTPMCPNFPLPKKSVRAAPPPADDEQSSESDDEQSSETAEEDVARTGTEG